MSVFGAEYYPRPMRPVVTPWASGDVGKPFAATGAAAPATSVVTVWPAANRALFVPCTVTELVTVRKLFFYNGDAVAGNIDVGIYAADGTLLVSSGSTTQSGTSALQEFDVTDTVLGPGLYYLAAALSSTTARAFAFFQGDELGKRVGCAQMNSALPLPATATLAAFTGAVIPIMGFSLRTLVT